MRNSWRTALAAAALAALAAGCGGSPAHHAARLPSLTTAAKEAGCTNLLPDKNPGTTADAGCTYTATGQQAELSTFSTPRQQTAFVKSSRAVGATVTAQGSGWVITGGNAPTQTAPAQPAAEANWEQNSPGYQSWLDVGHVMHKLSQALNAGNYLAIIGPGALGFRLAGAAGAALQNPSPVDRHDFKQAMADFGFMGAALSANHITAAAHFGTKSLHALHTWARAAQPGAVGSDLCGEWSLPQSSNC